MRTELRKTKYKRANKVVIYNSEPSDQYKWLLDLQGVEVPFFMKDGIMIHGLPLKKCFPSNDPCPVPSTLKTMQECVLQCITYRNLMDVTLAWIKKSSASKQKAYLLNILVDRCLLRTDMRYCFGEFLVNETGPACIGFSKRKNQLMDRLGRYQQDCELKPISQPQSNPAKFYGEVTLMSSPEERLENTGYSAPATFVCTDVRQTALLCTFWHDNYRTVKNIPCWHKLKCDFSDRYTGKGCYTIRDDDWENCCTGPCEAHEGQCYTDREGQIQQPCTPKHREPQES